jgi:hypothetical protein
MPKTGEQKINELRRTIEYVWISSGSIKPIEASITSRIINDLLLNAVLTYHQLPHKPLKQVGISYLRYPHFLRPIYTPV